MGVGKSAIINEAIIFLYNRNHPVCKDGIIKVDISQATKHTIKQKIADSIKIQVG
jgi:hypothetical protein